MYLHLINDCFLPQYCVPWLCCPGCGETFSGPDVCREHCLTAHGSGFRKEFVVNGFQSLQEKQIDFFLLIAQALNLCSQDEPVYDDLYAVGELMCGRVKSYALGNPALMNENFRAQADCLNNLDFNKMSYDLPGENSVRRKHQQSPKFQTQISLQTVLREKCKVNLPNLAIVMLSHPRINALLIKLVVTNYPEFQFELGYTCSQQEFQFSRVGDEDVPVSTPTDIAPEDSSPASPIQNLLPDQNPPVVIPIDTSESYYDPEESMETYPSDPVENEPLNYVPPSPLSSEGGPLSECTGSLHESVLDSSESEDAA